MFISKSAFIFIQTYIRDETYLEREFNLKLNNIKELSVEFIHKFLHFRYIDFNINYNFKP